MKYINAFLLFISLYLCYFFVKFAGLFLSRKEKKHSKSVLYLGHTFREDAGDIYRTQKWAEILKQEGFRVDIKYTLSKKQFETYLARGDIRFYLVTLFKRTWQVLTSYKYGTVIVRRELLIYNDYGNLFLERFLLKIHPNAILDFDDASSYEKGEPREVTSLFGKIMLENGSRFTTSLTLYKKFIIPSIYYKEYLQNINNKVEDHNICIAPMCVDYEIYPQKKYHIFSDKPIVLGWLGSNANLVSLEYIIPQIDELHKSIPVKLIVVSGTIFKPDVAFEIENIQWSYETQIESMLKMDIGLMPLRNTFATEGKDRSKVITKGKGGFKLIQYMGLGIVSVSDDTIIERLRLPNDINVVDDNIDGFLVKSTDTWFEVLKKILNSGNQFDKIGEMARKKIQKHYSFASNKDKYIKFISKDSFKQ